MFEATLADTGFIQVKEIPNLWVKDGVHVSIDEVMREGLHPTLARHQQAVRER